MSISYDEFEKVEGLSIENASAEEAAYIDNKLGEFNGTQVPLTQTEPVIYMNYVIKHEGIVIAGINAYLYLWGMLYISEFFVEEPYRKNGLGSRLLEHVESEARARGGRLSHCDTFDFQAKDFYLKHGYQIFGVLEDCPPDHRRYYLSKKLVVGIPI